MNKPIATPSLPPPACRHRLRTTARAEGPARSLVQARSSASPPPLLRLSSAYPPPTSHRSEPLSPADKPARTDPEQTDLEEIDIEKIDLEPIDLEKIDLDHIDLEQLAAGLDLASLDLANLDPTAVEAADIDLPPMAGGEARRLLVFLPAAGSTPGAHVMAAVAWQQKFRTARAVLLAAPHVASAEAEAAANADPAAAANPAAAGPRRRYWVDPAEYPVSAESIRREAAAVAGRIQDWQTRTGIDASQTILVGFSQGASIALELGFEPWTVASIIVAFAPRLYRLPVEGDAIHPTIHLIHGRYDTVIPLAHAEAALRRLGAVAAETSLDIVEDGGHVVDQDHLNIATQRAMQTVFAARRERGDQPLH